LNPKPQQVIQSIKRPRF